MNRRTFLALAAAAACAPALGTARRRLTGVDPDRLARLARGVNLSHWMWFPHAQGESGRRGFIVARDVEQLAAAGFTHVRLPFEPSWLWDHESGRLRERELAEYVSAMNLCLAGGLAVLVDAHWSRTPWIRPRAESDEERFGELDRMWRALAARLSGTDPERVFLELVNEPHNLRAAEHWHSAQRLIAATVRGAAPRHTIIATGDEYGGIDGLLKLAPLDDDNVVYSFHFYEPHNFTHQAAEWGFPPWRDMKGIPWPAERAELERIAADFPQESRNALRWSSREGGTDPWNEAALRARIARSAAWAREHAVPIYCGEFGVYTKASPRANRLSWHRALVSSLEEYKIGWALWDYIGGFALAKGAPGARELDGDLCEALLLPKGGSR